MRRIAGVVVTVLGMLLVAAAPVVHWVVAPRVAVLPADLATARVYTGTAATLANPTALTGTTFGPGLLRDVPITVRHFDKVLATQGGRALVQDQRTVSVPGFTVADLTYRVGVDRKTFMPAAGFSGATPTQGVVFNFPMSTKPHGYVGWVPDTGGTTVLRYAGQERRGGVLTDKFTTTLPPTLITDPQLLALLPQSMTKKQLMQLTPSLLFSTKRLLKLNDTLATLPDPVPLAYTLATTATFWVAPASGIVVDLRQHDVRSVAFVDGAKRIPVAPVMDISYTSTPTTLAAAAGDARAAAHQLTLIRTTIPLVALIVGVGLLIFGAALIVLFGRRKQPPAIPQREADLDLEELLPV